MKLCSVSFVDMALSSQCSSTTSRFELDDDALLVKATGSIALSHLERMNMYSLEELAQFVTSQSPKDRQNLFNDDSQISARDIIKFLIQNHEGDCQYHINTILKVKNMSISVIPACYFNAKKNKGDVVVCKNNTTLLYVEVHSGQGADTFVQTTRKTILCLLSYLRLLKAFSCVEPEISAFVFPRNEVRQCVVRVKMQYIANSVKFAYSLNCLNLDEVGRELVDALLTNKMVCQNLDPHPNFNYIVFLSDQEIEGKWKRQGYKLHKSKFGILLMNENKCLKKPLYKSHYSRIEILYLRNTIKPGSIHHIPTYSLVKDGFFTYDKVPHDPLSLGEAKLCSCKLVKKVHQIIQDLHNEGIMHHDLRLPNICFDATFNPVLIDLEFSEDFEPEFSDCDMEMFGEELKAVFSLEKNEDEFLNKFTLGVYDTEELKHSVVATGRETVRDVIRRR